jgi:lipoate-protein ligase B
MILPGQGSAIDPPELKARWLGSLPYLDAYQLQRSLHLQRIEGEIPDQLLLLEHPPVFTIPRRSKSENLLAPQASLAKQGIELVATDRGGEITFHNPGQLVGYLICRLEPGKRDLHSYLRWIEVTLQQVAKHFEVETIRRQGLTGVWVEKRKLASIGIAVKRWVTLHGFALNVNNNLAAFGLIHPCGLQGVQMTSLSMERKRPVPWEELLKATCEAFGAVLAAPPGEPGVKAPGSAYEVPWKGTNSG